MAFREVPVFEVREVLRLWLRGETLRGIERLSQGRPQDGAALRGGGRRPKASSVTAERTSSATS